MEDYQVEWASQHDWFKLAYKNRQGNLIVIAIDNVTNELVEFDNICDLRNWAGY